MSAHRMVQYTTQTTWSSSINAVSWIWSSAYSSHFGLTVANSFQAGLITDTVMKSQPNAMASLAINIEFSKEIKETGDNEPIISTWWLAGKGLISPDDDWNNLAFKMSKQENFEPVGEPWRTSLDFVLFVLASLAWFSRLQSVFQSEKQHIYTHL